MLRASKVLVAGVLGLIWVSAAFPQDVSSQLISAKAGMVNYFDGKPMLSHGLNDGDPVVLRDQLRAGDRVRLGESERIEFLLNPGSYLRIAGRAELNVIRTAFEDMQFGLAEGTAIVESSVFDRKVHALQVSTPAGDIKVVEGGLYRIEVLPQRPVVVSVVRGQAKWLRDHKQIASLKSGKRYTLADGVGENLQSVKLDKTQMDDLDFWSRRRAEYLVAANSRMSSWAQQTAYLGYGYRYGGGWAYNPFYNCFTFVPFGSAFFSPYGYSYRNYFPVYDRPWWYGGRGGGGSGNQGEGVSVPRSTSVSTRSSVSSAPSAPSPRMDSGRSDVGSRSGAHGGIRR